MLRNGAECQSDALTTLANDLHGIGFHQHRLQTAMYSRAEYLVQQKVDQAVQIETEREREVFLQYSS